MSSMPSSAFDTSHAEAYDRQHEALAAVKDSLHLLLGAAFAGLPAGARMLLVGAGTGAEARFLARSNPTWRFVLVDPSAPMLAVARRHAAAEGFLDRCEFHEGFLGSCEARGFDAATSLFASHFVTDGGQRRRYYADIAERLRPGAPLFEAGLCADVGAADFEPNMALWQGLLDRALSLGEEKKAAYRAAFGRDFAAHGPAEVTAMMVAAGFPGPAACYHLALVRGWVARRG